MPGADRRGARPRPRRRADRRRRGRRRRVGEAAISYPLDLAGDARPADGRDAPRPCHADRRPRLRAASRSRDARHRARGPTTARAEARTALRRIGRASEPARRAARRRRRSCWRRETRSTRARAARGDAGSRRSRPASTATIISARCWSPRTTSSSSTSRASRGARWPSAAQKTSPLRDVAGMLRSFDYAAVGRARSHRDARRRSCPSASPPRRGPGATRAEAQFLAGLSRGRRAMPAIPRREAARGLLDLFLLQKAALRDRLRGGQPAGLAVDPGARRARLSPATHARGGHDRVPSTTPADGWRPDAGRHRGHRRRRGTAIRSPCLVRMRRRTAACRCACSRPVPRPSRSIDARRRAPLAQLQRLHDAGFFAGRVAGRRSASPTASPSQRRRHAWDAEDPYRFPPCSARSTSICSPKARIAGSTSGSARIRSTIEASTACASPSGRPMRGASAWSATSTPGTAAAIPCACASRRASGSCSFPACRRRRASTSTRSSAPDGDLLPLKADPFALRARSCRRRPPRACTACRDHRLERRRLDGGARASAQAPRRADLDLRGAPRLLAARATATRFSTTRACRRARPLRRATWASPTSSCCRSASTRSRGSWGYQPIGLFAPTAPLRPPGGLRLLRRPLPSRRPRRHPRLGAGAFPADAHGLARFDGTALYEHEDPRLGFHQDWNTLIYNFGRREVRELPDRQRALLARALPRRRAAGRCRRLDALSRLQPASRRVDPQRPRRPREPRGDRLPAQLNALRRRALPGAITIAEESTAWPRVSRPVDGGGLGFGYKWNMGWMHDTLRYMSKEPVHRRLPPHEHDLRPALRVPREFRPAADPRRGRARQGLAARQDARRPLAEVRQPARLFRASCGRIPARSCCSWAASSARSASGTTTSRSTGTARRADASRRAGAWCAISTRSIARRRRCTSSTARPRASSGSIGDDADQSVLAFLRTASDGSSPVAGRVQLHADRRATATASACRARGPWRESLNTDAARLRRQRTSATAAASTRAERPRTAGRIRWSSRLPPLATIVLERLTRARSDA